MSYGKLRYHNGGFECLRQQQRFDCLDIVRLPADFTDQEEVQLGDFELDPRGGRNLSVCMGAHFDSEVCDPYRVAADNSLIATQRPDHGVVHVLTNHDTSESSSLGDLRRIHCSSRYSRSVTKHWENAQQIELAVAKLQI